MIVYCNKELTKIKLVGHGINDVECAAISTLVYSHTNLLMEFGNKYMIGEVTIKDDGQDTFEIECKNESETVHKIMENLLLYLEQISEKYKGSIEFKKGE